MGASGVERKSDSADNLTGTSTIFLVYCSHSDCELNWEIFIITFTFTRNEMGKQF